MNCKVLGFIMMLTVIVMMENSKAQTGQNGNYKSRTVDQAKLAEHREKLLLRSLSDNYNCLPGEAKDSICVPVYSTGCSMGDGFTDFAVAEIENYASGCEDLNGTGWSQYLELGPALLLPGMTYDFIMSTGYGDQYVTIWIDFNNDLLLTPEEKILSDFHMSSPGTFYTAQVMLPANADGGQHFMRARTNWAGSCNDPCEGYTYGEAEDYNVIVASAAFGSLEGIVTQLNSGEPVAGALISLTGTYNYSDTTDSDGYYLIENILEGTYNITCSKPGYNSQTSDITISEDSLSVADFVLTHPEIFVSPESVDIILLPNTTGEKNIIVGNSGDGPLNWSASLQIISKQSKEFMDLQFQYPVEIGGGEAGVETDGEFYYTTKWNGAEIYKYGIDGTYLGSFTIDGVSGLRDLAYDGTYFYGGAGLSTVFEMDFTNQILVSSFTAPTDCRGIAYDESGDVFYANNWNSPIIKFDKTGANLGSFNVGPLGGEYYGFAYDGSTLGGPYLWGYAQLGDSKNEIIQILLPSGTETGFTLDLATKLTGTFYNFAGGLFTHANLVLGKWTLGGLVQNQWIWGLELTDAQTWISVSPAGGSLQPEDSDTVQVNFNATDLIPGLYKAQLNITTVPDVGTPLVAITLSVTDETLEPPSDLTYSVVCDSAELCWEIGNPTLVDSFYVSIDETILSTAEQCFYVKGPGSHTCFVVAWYEGVPSLPSDSLLLEIPVPENSEPIEFTIDQIIGNIVFSSWQAPSGCAAWEGYNIYRDGVMINQELIGTTLYSDTIDYGGSYQYYVTAVYYFGESEPSNIDTVVIPSVQEMAENELLIFPNPANDILSLRSAHEILKVCLMNHSGKTQFVRKNNGTHINLDVSTLATGIYYLKVEFRDTCAFRKVVIR
jgi:hypothetical protein